MKPRRNPLKASAYATESKPCALNHGFDDRNGVHFTREFEVAVKYAVFKAYDEQNAPVVLTYEGRGLALVTDHDAVVEQKYETGLHNLLEIASTIGYWDDPDYPLEDLLEAAADSEAEYSEPVDNVEEALIKNAQPGIVNALHKYDDEFVRSILENRYKNGTKLPLEVWAEAISQWRVMSDVGDEYLRKVEVIKPMYLSFGEEEDDDDGPDRFIDPYEIYVTTKTLWESTKPIKDPIYHGTDTSRANAALSSVHVYNPWPFGMPRKD
jgi:hypothetical protein